MSRARAGPAPAAPIEPALFLDTHQCHSEDLGDRPVHAEPSADWLTQNIGQDLLEALTAKALNALHADQRFNRLL